MTARESTHSLVDYSYEDVAVMSIHPDGQEHWSAVLHKRQYSQDDDAAYSSFFLMKGSRNIRMVYNDEIRPENTVSEYVINGDGGLERRVVMNTEDQKLKLQFTEAIQVDASTVIVPSLHRYKLKLVKISYDS